MPPNGCGECAGEAALDLETLVAERDISLLVKGWTYRDLGQWDRLKRLFHPDATIALAWFEGPFAKFVAASEKMEASDMRARHLVGAPLVTIGEAQERAVAETTIVVFAENRKLKLACQALARFVDLVERRDGAWKIMRRDSIHDMAAFMFPRGPVGVDEEPLARYPLEYASLAYLLEKSGVQVRRGLPIAGSEAEKALHAEAHRWLREQA
jgi:hypothetical protein